MRPATILISLALSLAACAPIPRPALLTSLDHVREGAAGVEASRYAPDAFAHAEKLRTEAAAAFDGGDLAGAQLLAERAHAAYARAAALARIARADATSTEAKSALAAAESELSAIDADQARVGADADALELKVRVARDAQPIQPSGRANPERERARLAAARSLAMEARLLCGAAKLLASPPPGEKIKAQLDEAEAALTKVDADLAPAATTAPIDGATRARAGCLAALTSLRRAASPTDRAPGAGDALLAALSATGHFTAARDDRGVTVALRGAFGGGNALTPQAEARLAELGKVAAAHPTFPIEVVFHSDRPVAGREEDAAKARAEAALKALAKTAGGNLRATAIVAGDRVPVADPKGPDKARNARVEVVFVTPEMF